MVALPIVALRADNVFFASYFCSKVMDEDIETNNVFNDASTEMLDGAARAAVTVLDTVSPTLAKETDICIGGAVLLSLFAFIAFQTLTGYQLFISRQYMGDGLLREAVKKEERKKTEYKSRINNALEVKMTKTSLIAVQNVLLRAKERRGTLRTEVSDSMASVRNPNAIN